MAARSSRNSERSGLDLVEEATQLLRRAPASALISYYVGSIPGVLGLLYFFADMSRGAFAGAHLGETALGCAVFYLWMKCWHTVFASRLHAALALEPPAPWSVARVVRLVCVQSAIQPTGLFARFIAAQMLIPYIWVYGFYQNVGVLGDGQSASVRDVLRRSAALARLWPGQAHSALLQIFIFGFIVALNLGVAVFLIPLLLKTFFDLQTVFSQSPMSLLNTTLFAVVAGLTYLAVDPLRKTIYVLRCFYGSAFESGADLRVALKKFNFAASKIAAAAILIFLCTPALPAFAAAARAPASEVDPERLDRSIEQVLERREFAWRMPREKAPPTEDGWISSLARDLAKTVRHWFQKGSDATSWLRDKIRGWFGLDNPREHLGEDGWKLADSARPILYATIGLLAISLLVIIRRARRQARPAIPLEASSALVLDLNSEDLVADQLPEDGWLKLARDLMEAGELRLALRASYLAGLAHLGQRQLLTIARHKSNLDYDRELRRRARPQQELVSAFAANMGAFESAWYGLHEVTIETLGGFNQNLERIRAC